MKLGIVALLCVLALALTAIPANAQFFSLKFDENGNGLLNGTTPDQGTLMVDPQSGLTALAYALPSLVSSGDVGVMDPDGSFGDGLRFEDINGVSYMFYFSDNSDGGGSLADTGLPSGNFQNFFVTEVGTENVNSFTYLVGGGGNNSYFGISDTPEPSSLLLTASGLLGLVGVARRRFLS
jgi:hypothetical protein